MKADKWFLFFVVIVLFFVATPRAKALRIGQDCIIDGKNQSCPAFINSVTLWDESESDNWGEATDDAFITDGWEDFDKTLITFPAPRQINMNWEEIGNYDKVANIRLWQACGPTIDTLGSYSFVSQRLNNIIWKPVKNSNNCFCRLRLEAIGEDSKTIYGYSITRPIQICNFTKINKPIVLLKGAKNNPYYTTVNFDISSLGNDSKVEISLHLYPEVDLSNFSSFPGDSPYLAYKGIFESVGLKTATLFNFKRGCIRLQAKNLAGTFFGSTICASNLGRILTPPVVGTNNYDATQMGATNNPKIGGYVSDLGGDDNVRAWIAIKDKSTGKFLPNTVGPFLQKLGEFKGAFPLNSQNKEFCYQARALNRAGFGVGQEICANKKSIQIETVDINQQSTTQIGTTYFRPLRALVKSVEQKDLPLTVWFYIYEAQGKRFPNSPEVYYECNEKYIGDKPIKYGLVTYPVEYLKRYNYSNFAIQSDAVKNLKPNTNYCYQVFAKNDLSSGNGRPVMIQTRSGEKIDYEPTVLDKDVIVYQPIDSNKVEFQGYLAYIGVNSGKYKNEASCWFEIGDCLNFDATKKKSKEQKFTADGSNIEATFDNIIKDLGLRSEYKYCFQTKCRNSAGKENAIAKDYKRTYFIIHNPLKVETLPILENDIGNHSANLSLDIRGRGPKGTLLAWIFVYRAQAFKTNGEPDCSSEPKWEEGKPKADMQIGKITITAEDIGNPIKYFHFENLAIGKYYCYQARLQNVENKSAGTVSGKKLFFKTQSAHAPKVQTLPVDQKTITQKSALLSAKLLAHGDETSLTNIWLWGFQAKLDENGQPICNIQTAQEALDREKSDTSKEKKYIFREIGFKRGARISADNKPTISGLASNLNPGAYYCYQALAQGAGLIGKGEYSYFKLKDAQPTFTLPETDKDNTKPDTAGKNAIYKVNVRLDNSGNGLDTAQLFVRWWDKNLIPNSKLGNYWYSSNSEKVSVLFDGVYYVGPIDVKQGVMNEIPIGLGLEGVFMLEKGKEYYYQVKVVQKSGSQSNASVIDPKYSVRLNDPKATIAFPDITIGSEKKVKIFLKAQIEPRGASQAEVVFEYKSIDWDMCQQIFADKTNDFSEFKQGCNSWIRPFYDRNTKFTTNFSPSVLMDFSNSQNSHIVTMPQEFPSTGIYAYRVKVMTNCINPQVRSCLGYSKWRIFQPYSVNQDWRQEGGSEGYHGDVCRRSGCLSISARLQHAFAYANYKEVYDLWNTKTKGKPFNFENLEKFMVGNGAGAVEGAMWGGPYPDVICLGMKAVTYNNAQKNIDDINNEYLKKGISAFVRCTSQGGRHFFLVRGIEYVKEGSKSPEDKIFITESSKAREGSGESIGIMGVEDGNTYITRKTFSGSGFYCGEGGGGPGAGSEYDIFEVDPNADVSQCYYP